MFGVGGGFLLTPLLIFSGISPAVAVATVTPQIVASSTSAAISYWRRRLIDEKMTLLLGGGGIVGSALGVYAFRALRVVGQLDLIIALSYVAFLGSIGTIMLRESVRAILATALRPRSRGQAAGPPQLDPRPAAEDALPALQALCERHSDHRARLRHRLPRHDPRNGRRLHHGAGADLSPARAVECRHRHVARLHADDDDRGDDPARHGQQVRRRDAGAGADGRRRRRRAVRRAGRAGAARRAVARACSRSSCSRWRSACCSACSSRRTRFSRSAWRGARYEAHPRRHALARRGARPDMRKA